jgi:hypothetical protein
MKKKNGKEVERKLTISYKVIAFLQEPVTFFITAFIINIVVASVIHRFFRDIIDFAPSSALQVLGTIVESSSTVLAIFFALVIFLLNRPPELRRVFSAGEFFSACFTFSLSIISGLANMALIEPDKRVDGIVIFIPTYFLIASLFFFFLFFFSVFRKWHTIQSQRHLYKCVCMIVFLQ